jgi:hypothetical protein
MMIWQSEHAVDPVVASSLGRIARDEIRHAELGWAIASWIERRMNRPSALRVRRARTEAARALRAVIRADCRALDDGRAGIVPPGIATSIIERLTDALW